MAAMAAAAALLAVSWAACASGSPTAMAEGPGLGELLVPLRPGQLPSDAEWEAFSSMRASLLASEAPSANAAMEALAKADRCGMVRYLVQSVGHCPFTDAEDPSQLQAMGRWMDTCQVNAESTAQTNQFDQWYGREQRRLWAEKDHGGANFVAYSEAGRLTAELHELTVVTGKERERAMGKAGEFLQVVKADGLDAGEMAKVVEGVRARARKSGFLVEDELGPLTLLLFVLRHENPFLLSREETWRAMNADAAARCTFTRASLRRSEVAWELMAVLSGKTILDSVKASCQLASPLSFTMTDVVLSASAGENPSSHDCDQAAGVIQAGIGAMASTRVGAKFAATFVNPARTHSIYTAGPTMPHIELFDVIRRAPSVTSSVLATLFTSPTMVLQAFRAEDMSVATQADEVTKLVLSSMAVTKDLQPLRTFTKLVSTTMAKISSVEDMLHRREEDYHLIITGLNRRVQLEDLAAVERTSLVLRQRWYEALANSPLAKLDDRAAKAIAATRDLTANKLLPHLRHSPVTAAVVRMVARLTPRSVMRMALVADLVALWAVPAKAVDMLKHSVALAELGQAMIVPAWLPEAFQRGMSATAGAWNRATLTVFRYGRAARLPAFVSSARSALSAVAVRGTRAGAAAAKAVGKAAARGVARMLGPLSLALDAFDSYDYYSNGHTGAAVAKGVAAVATLVAVSVSLMLPGIGLLAIFGSIVLSGAADFAVHAAEKAARRDLATALGFRVGADRDGELEFVLGTTCAKIGELSVPVLQATLAGLTDGWTRLKYERGVIRVFECLHQAGRCDKARKAVEHASGELSGENLLDQIDHSPSHGRALRAMARCGVDPGVGDPDVAKRFVMARSCPDMAHQDSVEQLTRTARALAKDGDRRHTDAMLVLVQCLTVQGHCPKVRKIIAGVGASLMMESSAQRLRKDHFFVAVEACNVLELDHPGMAARAVSRMHLKGTLAHRLASEPVSTLRTLAAALIEGKRGWELSLVVRALAPHESKLLGVLNHKPTAYWRVTRLLAQGGRQEALAVLPKKVDSSVRCYYHKGEGVVLAKGGCRLKPNGPRPFGMLTTCSADSMCETTHDENGIVCRGRCVCGTSGLNECRCVDTPRGACRMFLDL